MWTEYFARIFPKVTEQDIARFEVDYRSSDEERRDVLAAYETHEGDMGKIIDCVMLCSDDDEVRFAEMIDQAIKKEQVRLVFEPPSVGSQSVATDSFDGRFRRFPHGRNSLRRCASRRPTRLPPRSASAHATPPKRLAKRRSSSQKSAATSSSAATDSTRPNCRFSGAFAPHWRPIGALLCAHFCIVVVCCSERKFSSLISDLETKYASQDKASKRPKKSARAKATPSFVEPSEEEFLATQKRITKRKK